MKAWVYFLTAGVGGAVGFAAGYFLSKRKYEKITDNEIKEVKEYYKKKSENEKKVNDISEKQEKQTETKIDKSFEANKVKYDKVGDDEEMLAEKESPEEEMPDKPFLITEDEFSNGMNEYDKISLTYYVMDDTLADDFGEMVDIEETISSDIFNQLADAEEDVYVRNPILEIDYEIMRIDGSYVSRYMQ